MNFTLRGIQTFEYIPNPLSEPIAFCRAIFGNLMGFKKIYVLMAGMLLTFLLPHQARLKQAGFLLIMIGIPLQLLLLADLQKSYWFIQRQFVWVMAFYAFFLGWCWDSVAGYAYARNDRSRLKRT